MHPPEVDIHTYTGAAWLGIDAGSTTTKIALITADGGLLYTYYHSNLGNPVAIVLEQLREIYKLCGSRITIKGAAVTGYGEDLIKNAFSCDAGLVGHFLDVAMTVHCLSTVTRGRFTTAVRTCCVPCCLKKKNTLKIKGYEKDD